MSKYIFEIEYARVILTAGDDSLYGEARNTLREAAREAKKNYLCEDSKEAIKEFLVNFFNFVGEDYGLRSALSSIKYEFLEENMSSVEIKLGSLPLTEGECVLEVRARKCISLLLD